MPIFFFSWCCCQDIMTHLCKNRFYKELKIIWSYTIRVWQFLSIKVSINAQIQWKHLKYLQFCVIFFSTVGVSAIQFAGGVPSNHNKSIIVEEKSQWKGYNSLEPFVVWTNYFENMLHIIVNKELLSRDWTEIFWLVSIKLIWYQKSLTCTIKLFLLILFKAEFVKAPLKI